MAPTLPSSSHVAGDPNHPADHDLLAAAAALALYNQAGAVPFAGSRATGLAVPAASTDAARPADISESASTAVIIPSNAPAWAQALAPWMPNIYLCSGSNDDTVIQTAVTALTSSGNNGGEIILFDGAYSFDGVGVTVDNITKPVQIRGRRGSATINVNSGFTGTAAFTFGATGIQQRVRIAGVTINGANLLTAKPGTQLSGSTLDAPLPGTVEQVTVSSTTGWAVGDVMQVGWTNYEWWRVTSIDSSGLAHVVRGAYGSPITAWNPAATGGVPIVHAVRGIDFSAGDSHIEDVTVQSMPGSGIWVRPYNWGQVTYLSGTINTSVTSLPVTATTFAIPDATVLTVSTGAGGNAERMQVSNSGSPVAIGATAIPVTRSFGGTTAVSQSTGAQVQVEATTVFELYIRDVHCRANAGDQLHLGSFFYQGAVQTATMNNSEIHRVYGIGANASSGSSPQRGRSGFYLDGCGGAKMLDCHPYYNQFNGVEGRTNSVSMEFLGGEYETNGQGNNTTGGIGIHGVGATRWTLKGQRFYANNTACIVLDTLIGGAQCVIDDPAAYLLPTTCLRAFQFFGSTSGVDVGCLIRGVRINGSGATSLAIGVDVQSVNGTIVDGVTVSGVPTTGFREVNVANSLHTRITLQNLRYGVYESGTSDYTIVEASSALNSSTLTALTSGSTTGTADAWSVASGANFATGQTLYVPSTGEQATVTSVSGTTVNVTRGANSSIATVGAASSASIQVLPNNSGFNTNSHSRIDARETSVGIVTRHSGTFTITGDGTTTTFTIPHGLTMSPSTVPRIAYTGATSGATLPTTTQVVAKPGTTPATNFQVVFTTAPANAVVWTFTFDAYGYGV